MTGHLSGIFTRTLMNPFPGCEDAESQTLLLTPSNPAVNIGQSVTFTCNTGVKDGDAAHLLKQMPGEAPQVIIYTHHSFSSPRYGPGISSDRFTSSINSAATEYYFTSDVPNVSRHIAYHHQHSHHSSFTCQWKLPSGLESGHTVLDSYSTTVYLCALCDSSNKSYIYHCSINDSGWIRFDAESQTLLLTPSNPIVNVGESVTFTCNVGVKDGSWVNFLKQISGEAPQRIIYNHHSVSSPGFGPGISSDRFTASINSAATEYYFTIRKPEIADTALYYCVKWYCAVVRFELYQIFIVLYTGDVDSQTPLLTPAVLSMNKGVTTTFNCDVGVKNNHATVFYRQSPGDVPQLLLYHHHSYTEPKYGPGMSSAHYGCTINSAGTQYQLVIKNTDTSDTGLLYCSKWYDNVGNHYSGGRGIEMSNVDSQTPLLTPTHLSVNKGQTATFNCDVGIKDGYVTAFLRQSPGEAPQLLLYHHNSYTEPKYGPGMSSSHYGSTTPLGSISEGRVKRRGGGARPRYTVQPVLAESSEHSLTGFH
ncbi:S14077Ig kappa chain - African clawed frog [Pelobates cultripes]|uniref:S14077Ig kappa chain - African clawed frog n=1 Tax=Pelobates cultripes TaxID=61616 RepID=A0AAD1S5U1_PELCU|nr:S14077Ig kappa chain - African clawed frog [Pelobates cultripes]